MNALLDKIYVDNLKCNGCSMIIKNNLMKIVGVLDVKTSPEEGWVEIEHEDFTNIESIYEKLAELGYPKVGKGSL
jgi:copper chaperone